MDIRDAVEADAPALAAMSEVPADVWRELVHDRTVRVAVEDGAKGADEQRDGSEHETDDIAGLVSFDVSEGAVRVTQLRGTDAACKRLLGEPTRFAEHEGLPVEFLVPESDETARTAAEALGFERAGSGPRFEGSETTRYRLEPAAS